MQRTISTTYAGYEAKPSIMKRFMNWAEGQNKNRMGWIGGILAGHGCIITPITLFAIIFSGNHIFFWLLAIVSMMAALVTNLAALPTKITIPVFLLSIVIDVTIIVSCVSIGFNISGTYI